MTLPNQTTATLGETVDLATQPTTAVRSDLELAWDALIAKRAEHDKYLSYYDGEQQVVYAASRLEEVFKNVDADFSENWCEVVISAALERMKLTGFSTKDTAVQDLLSQISRDVKLTLEAQVVHEVALVTGEAYLIVWPDPEEPETPALYYNDPRTCHLFYQADSPNKKDFAAKFWTDDTTGLIRATLYYADRLEYYISLTANPSNGKSFVPYYDPKVGSARAENPYNRVPVFHFRPSRRLVKSDLINVIRLQDSVNKLLLDMMVAAEFGAFKQRWVISNSDTSALKNAPNQVWEVPAGDGMGQQTAVGEFSATELKNYLDAIETLASHIAVITRTPKHLFFRQGGDPSGEALHAMEAPLLRKVEARTDQFSEAWVEVGEFLLELVGSQVPADGLTPVFKNAATEQPKTRAETTQLRVAAGIPLNTVLRREEGWTEAELADMEEEKQVADEAKQEQMATALLNAERSMNRSGQPGDQPADREETSED